MLASYFRSGTPGDEAPPKVNGEEAPLATLGKRGANGEPAPPNTVAKGELAPPTPNGATSYVPWHQRRWHQKLLRALPAFVSAASIASLLHTH